MRTLIELENMEFKAFHGCYDLEKKVGNLFRVDVAIEAEIGDAAAKDSIGETVNYLTVFELVREQMAVTSDIIENVAERIIDAIRARFPQVLRVTAKVSKLAPPLGGKIERVSVTLTKYGARGKC